MPSRAFAGLLSFCLIAPCAGKEVLPPSHALESQVRKATMPGKPAKGAEAGNTRIIFGQTTLAEFATSAGAGQVGHAGEAGNSVYWLCYTVPGKAPARLWLKSDGEMGGPDHSVTGLVLTLAEAAPAECPALPAHLQPVIFGRNLSLGASADALASELGAPPARQNDWVMYDYKGKRGGNCRGGYDVLNSLIAKLERGVVTAIHAREIVSC